MKYLRVIVIMLLAVSGQLPRRKSVLAAFNYWTATRSTGLVLSMRQHGQLRARRLRDSI